MFGSPAQNQSRLHYFVCSIARCDYLPEGTGKSHLALMAYCFNEFSRGRMPNLISYQQALESTGNGRKHILLGNGFSVSCDSIFQYANLYEVARHAGLSPRAQEVFKKLGTCNFEGVMRLLDDSHWIAQTYQLIVSDDTTTILSDVEIIKRTLVASVAAAHLPNTGSIPEDRKLAALKFLSPYHNIYTTNYDLLPYWVNLSSKEKPIWQDGFRSSDEDPDAPYVVFSHALADNKGLFYLHGALHLFVKAGELRKHCWNRTGRPLTDLITEGLQNDAYPLFIAEGDSPKKTEQIQRSGYLWYCYSKLSRSENPLVVFGHSLGPSDAHICEAIVRSKCQYVVVGLHGDVDAPYNQEIVKSLYQMQASRKQLIEHGHSKVSLSFEFFDSATAPAWG